MMLFSQILFIIYAMFLPISFLLSMIPTYENMAKQAVVRVFNAIMTRAGITLIVTVAFSISSMFYNISTDYPFFMVAFLQIICFAGIYMKLGELMSMFSLNANDSQQIGRRIFRRPMVFMRHRARRMERRIARAVGAGSVAGTVAGASIARAGKPATNQPPKKRENTSASMGSRVGSAVGAVMDTKNKVRDSASSLKENVKDLPTQAGYAVHSAKQKAKDNVSDFKRGVVEERENRQEQRTQKRNLHRENISQKKQELQKAQEARQTVHANGSATAGATRSHERPVATPVPKTAQTDTVIKPDMKRPATSPVIKNVEVKAGKETVRTNIRQEQQVKGVTRTNQPNVVESRSNQKKTTIQKQVNQKQNRKTVTGKSVKNPSNFLTRMGTPMSQLIDAAGGLPEDTGKVIGGGPMMGKALVNTEVPICKGSSGVLIMNDKEAARAEAQPCIRCAKCVSVCPMGLEPFLLATLSAHKDWERVEKEDVMSCIECGSCQFTCPSHRYLLDYIRLGKGTVGGIIRARNAKK